MISSNMYGNMHVLLFVCSRLLSMLHSGKSFYVVGEGIDRNTQVNT